MGSDIQSHVVPDPPPRNILVTTFAPPLAEGKLSSKALKASRRDPAGCPSARVISKSRSRTLNLGHVSVAPASKFHGSHRKAQTRPLKLSLAQRPCGILDQPRTVKATLVDFGSSQPPSFGAMIAGRSRLSTRTSATFNVVARSLQIWNSPRADEIDNNEKPIAAIVRLPNMAFPIIIRRKQISVIFKVRHTLKFGKDAVIPHLDRRSIRRINSRASGS
ncbi:hypothetical protein SAMN05519103_00509 [Rhizobiales bacterium GAS113]|nr:hypothetical protein SAMN05519103_00509 [Rhizobiales bacterium GAS113]